MFRLAVIIIFLFCASISYAQEEKSIQTQEIADPNLWDFAQVKEGTVLEHKFIFKNESSRVININVVNTSCGCTVSKVKKKRLQPQESTEIEVKFKSKGYSGQVKQFIYVHTDNVGEPVVRFIIKAEVIKK